jgi:predicted methyltransferase MtxX (methanogen marker protein 4)
MGIPDDVEAALRGRLRAAGTMLELARAWGLPERVTQTSGGRF